MSLSSLPIVITANGRSSQRAGDGAMSAISPATFRIDLSSPMLESGLRFDAPSAKKSTQVARVGGLPVNGFEKPQSSADAPTVVMGKNVARLMFMSQVLIVVTLALIVFSLVFISYRFNYNVNWYYAAAQPYLSELRQRSMSMVRNADHSSEEMEVMMSQTGALVAQSVPSIMSTLNRTADMIARLDRVARNPVMKISME